MKLISRKLLENGQGDYMVQVALPHREVKALRNLVQKELNRQRASGKDDSWVALDNAIACLYDTERLLRLAYDKRQEGRYKAKLKVTDLKPSVSEAKSRSSKSQSKATLKKGDK